MSDYLSDEEQVAALKNWWNENGKALLIGLALAVAAVLGWRGYENYSRQEAEAAAALYLSFQQERAAETPDPDELARVAEALATDHPRSGYRTFVLLYQAADAVGADDYELAREYLAVAVDTASDPRLKDVARIRLARILQQLGESDAALATLSGVAGTGFVAEAAELKGDILLANGDRAGASEAYDAALAAVGGSQSPLLELKVRDMAETGSEVADAAVD